MASAVNLKESLLQLAHDGAASAFAEFVHSLSGKKSSTAGGLSLPELMSVLSKAENEQLWTSIIQRRWFATSISDIEGIPVEQVFDELQTLPSDTHGTESRTESVACLSAIATCIVQYVQGCQPKNVSADCFSLACNLHDLIFNFSANDDTEIALQKTIGKFCEIWCLQQMEGFENLAPRFIPLLLYAALAEDARQVDVRRLYALRNVLSIFDIDDTSSESLRGQLLNCFISPKFLEDKIGTKFLVHVFSLSPSMMSDVHNAVKNQIPFTKAKGLLVRYGELYYSVWDTANRSGNDAVRDRFETKCLQDFFFLAVHAHADVFKNLMRVLAPIHEHKRDTGGGGAAVDSMLLRLYRPFLWRSMEVAKSTVRRNAIVLLADLYPLQEPSLTAHVEIEELATRQHTAFATALMDPSPEVRVVAIEGACRILGTFWEIIPESFKKQYLTCFAKDLVYDQSSAAVRAAVFEGLTFVLDNRLCHSAMKRVLPSMANCIHDRSERVRGRFLDMLLQVKRIRDIRFFDVVPVEDLLERLACDAGKHTLAKKLTSLLLNSYFPEKGGVRERLSRAKVLMETNPAAAVAFYGNLRQHVALPDVCSLLDALNKCTVTILKVMSSRQGDQASSRKRSLGGDSEEEDGNEDQAEDVTVALKGHATKVLLLLHVITATWESIAKDLGKRGGAKAAAYLRATLAGDFCQTARRGLEPFFPPGVVEALLCRLAALLDAEDCGDFRAGILPKLAALAESGRMPSEAEFTPLVELSCQWELEGEIIDDALSAIEVALSANSLEEPGSRKGKATKRSLKGSNNKKQSGGAYAASKLSPTFSTHLLLLIFSKNFSGARDRVLESTATVERLRQCFERVLPEVAQRLESAYNLNTTTSPLLTDEALVNLVLCAFKLQIHVEIYERQVYGTSDEVPEAASLNNFCTMLNAVTQTIVPFFASFTEGEAASSVSSSKSSSTPARQRRRKKESGEHTPARLAAATNMRPAQGAAQQLLWSVVAVATATAHDYQALRLVSTSSSQTILLRFFSESTQAVAAATAATPTAHAFAVETAAIYRHTAAALAVLADPQATIIKSLAEWRVEHAGLVERALVGVLGINETAIVAGSSQLLRGFISKLAFSQSVITEHFVPVILAIAIRGSSGCAGVSQQQRSSAQARCASEQTNAITAEILAHAAKDSMVFKATCNALTDLADRLAADGGKASHINAACRLLTKVIAQGCGVGNDEGDDSTNIVPHLTARQQAEVRSTIANVRAWMNPQYSAEQQHHHVEEDSENAAPSNNSSQSSSSPSKINAGKASQPVSRFGDVLSKDVAAGLLGAVLAQVSS